MILDYCKKYSNLSAMKINLLYRINKVLPLVADLSHAHIAMYVKTKKEQEFIIVSAIEPHTTFNPFNQSPLGNCILSSLEPLITKSFNDKKIYYGQRELDFGKFLEMYTVPIIDNNEVIAVICFEINLEDSKLTGFSHLLNTAFTILKNAHKNLDENMYKAITAQHGIVITDKNERIIFANMIASQIYHLLGINNLLGRYVFDHKLTMYITKETISPQYPYEKEFEAGNLIIIRRDIPIMEAGNLLTRIIILSDVTELRKKDKELLIKSTVIQEIHHRVKNNLQTIASLLRLQARRSTSHEVKTALNESINRILSISIVHEFLSQQGEENIDILEVTKNILTLISQNMLADDFKLNMKFSSNTIILPSKQASNLALVINELILNSLEHGFSGRNYGTIGFDIKQSDKTYIIELYDDGIGFYKDNLNKNKKSLGLQIIKTLIEEDLGGSFELFNSNGVHAKIIIPYDNVTGV